MIDANHIRQLIADGETETALAHLESAIKQGGNDNLLNQVILLKAKEKDLRIESRNYGEDKEHRYQVQRLRSSVLSLLSELMNAPSEETQSNEKNNDHSYSPPDQTNKITRVQKLIDAWEEKKEISTDPTDFRRCEMELKRLKGILHTYLSDT